MKRIIFVLCCLIALLNNAYAGEMYNCIDSKGNSIITDIPQDDMKCESKESTDEASVGNLNGVWIFDPEATAEYIKATPEYRGKHKTGEHFGIAGHLLCVFLYEFNGDTVTVKMYTSDAKKGEFSLLSRDGNEIEYVLNNAGSSKQQIMNVSVLNSKNIKIYYSGQEEFDFLLWKRMTDKKNDIKSLIGQSLKPTFKTIQDVLFAEPDKENQAGPKKMKRRKTHKGIRS